MKILIFLDYSSFTEKMLAAAKMLTDNMLNPQIMVVHVNDERNFYSTTGIETELGENMERENAELRTACQQYLGESVEFHEEFGIPKLKIFESIEQLDYDLLIVGSHGNHGLGERLMGSIAEYILKHARTPVMIIP